MPLLILIVKYLYNNPEKNTYNNPENGWKNYDTRFLFSFYNF